MKKIVVIGSLSILLISAAYAYDIRHPNLRDAYGLAQQAITRVHDAYEANKAVGFGGHAEHAMDLLKQAQTELIEADKYNEAHQKR
jgi:hypothetical protein